MTTMVPKYFFPGEDDEYEDEFDEALDEGGEFLTSAGDVVSAVSANTSGADDYVVLEVIPMQDEEVR